MVRMYTHIQMQINKYTRYYNKKYHIYDAHRHGVEYCMNLRMLNIRDPFSRQTVIDAATTSITILFYSRS